MDKNRQQFDRIKLLTYMTNDIIAFAAQKYGPEFFDYIDMSCGAVPDGEYNNIIDPASPKQFLSLYTKIAIKRFSLTCNKLLQLGTAYLNVIKDYLYRKGAEIKPSNIETIEDAFYIVQEYILDDAQQDDKVFIKEQTENCLKWEKEHFDYDNYWKYMEALVQGLLDNSDIQFHIKDGIFILEKRDMS